MATEPKPSRGMPRSLLYVLIPGIFLVALVLYMLGILSGSETPAEAVATTDNTVPLPTETPPADPAAPATP